VHYDPPSVDADGNQTYHESPFWGWHQIYLYYFERVLGGWPGFERNHKSWVPHLRRVFLRLRWAFALRANRIGGREAAIRYFSSRNNALADHITGACP